MQESRDSWKQYWESRGSLAGSDHEADHRSSADIELDKIAESELLAFIDPQKNDKVLDAGCGTGANLCRLSPLVRSIVGIEYSEQMLSRAEKRLCTQGVRNATVQLGNIARMQLESDSFDKVICISVSQYLNNEECAAALKEFVRVCKEGGIIVLHVKNLASSYLSSLYAAKKLKSLVSTNVRMEYYRTQRWYERKLNEIGATPIQFDANHIFVVDFLPSRLYKWIVRTERKYYKSRFLRRFGSEYFIKATVSKEGAGLLRRSDRSSRSAN